MAAAAFGSDITAKPIAIRYCVRQYPRFPRDVQPVLSMSKGSSASRNDNIANMMPQSGLPHFGKFYVGGYTRIRARVEHPASFRVDQPH